MSIALRVVSRGEKFLHSENEAHVLEQLRGELYSVVGEERNRRAIHEHTVVHERFCHLESGDIHKRNRPHQLRVPVCDDKQKPIPAGVLKKSPKISMATKSSGLDAGKSFMSLEFLGSRTRFLVQVVQFLDVA